MGAQPLDAPAVVLRLLLPLLLLWLAASAAIGTGVYAVAVRHAARHASDPLPPAVWLTFAAGGAAVGGFLGMAATIPDAALARGVDGVLLPLFLPATLGMLLGAGFAVGMVLLWLWVIAADVT